MRAPPSKPKKAAKKAPKKAAKKAAKKKTAAKKPARKAPAKKATPKKTAKKPAGKARAKRKTPSEKPRRLLDLVTRVLDDAQADDVVIVDLKGKSAMADFMVVASGRNPRHIGAMAQNLREKIKGAGLGVPALEGMGNADWVLIDGGDVIVHLFRPEVRGLYNLEKMWRTEFRDVEAEYGLDRPR